MWCSTTKTFSNIIPSMPVPRRRSSINNYWKYEFDKVLNDIIDKEDILYKVYFTPVDNDIPSPNEIMGCPSSITALHEIIEWIEENECCSIDDIELVDCGDFGTEYHDGSGYADCDEDNTGWRKCKDEPNKDKWCSECIYISQPTAC